MSAADSLYAFVGELTGRVKFGRSADPDRRFDDLYYQGADRLIFWVSAPGIGYFESELHRALAGHRQHGEWFSETITQTMRKDVPQHDAVAFDRWVRAIILGKKSESRRKSESRPSQRLDGNGSRPRWKFQREALGMSR